MTKNAFILNFLKLYNMLWKLCMPFLKRNQRLKKGFSKRINPAHHSRQDIWIQAASAGEAYLAVKIIKAIKPVGKTNILITTNTVQGKEILKNNLTRGEIHSDINISIDWFLFDMPEVIIKAVQIINPAVMILLETELWPALLYYLKKNNTNVLILNARLSENSFKNYMRTRFLWKHLEPDVILATSELDRTRYTRLFKQSKVSIMNNIKFESVADDTFNSVTQAKISYLLNPDLKFTILASIRKQEEEDVILIIEELLKAYPAQTIGLFPRHMHRIVALARKLESRKIHFQLRSRLSPAQIQGPGVILWDVFGELKNAYGLASVVFVGGSLQPLGGQNFLEPAIQGTPTITGPYYDDFKWVGDQLFEKKIITKTDDCCSVSKNMISFLKKEFNRSDNKTKAAKYIQSKHGGTIMACNTISSSLNKKT